MGMKLRSNLAMRLQIFLEPLYLRLPLPRSHLPGDAVHFPMFLLEPELEGALGHNAMGVKWKALLVWGLWLSAGFGCFQMFLYGWQYFFFKWHLVRQMCPVPCVLIVGF